MRPSGASQSFLPPHRIGRYQVLLRIASGGMATVYLGRMRGIGGFERDVAIKLSHDSDQSEVSSDLVEEAKLASRLRHPNVVPVLDVGESPAGVFLVMDYVSGDSLAGLSRAARKAGEPLPKPIALRILLDGMVGLHAAHELLDDTGAPLGLVHRDFTPQNILVGTDGVARLTDFGIARAASRLVRTRTGDVKGKARYMSPEQARGLRLDRRCDVWAAGVMAWEILAEQPLFAADNELAMLLRIASDPVPLLSEARPDLGTSFDAALNAALTRDVAERCPDARELAQRLRAACDSAGLAIAGTEAVAETVQRLAGAKLAERAARVTEVVAVQARMREIDSAVAADDGTESAPPLAQSAKLTRQPPAVLAPHDADTDSTLVTDGGPRRRARLAGAGAVAAAALVLALVLAWRAVGARGEAGAGATPASGNAASAAALAPPPSSAPPPPTSVAAPQLPAPLAVFADALIVELRIGTRVVPVQPPSNGKVVERTAAEGGASLDISAIASDGRSATAVASPESTSVHLVFPPRNKPARDAPRAPPRAPELSPNPF